jgi:hypothetical protein
VRAASALSLGKLGDDTVRPDLVALLAGGSQLVSDAAEKALILLDEARGKPRYLIVIEAATLAEGVTSALAPRVPEKVAARIRTRSDLLLTAGEEKTLKPDLLDAHLKKRSLTGILLQPRILKLEAKTKGGDTVVTCKISVLTATLIKKRMEFAGNGEASAEVEGTSLSSSDRGEIDSTILEASANAATDQVIDYLGRRTGP